MYDRILVPTDGSSVSRAAAREAFRLADAFGATVHVVFVVDESASSLLLSGTSMSQVLEALQSEGESAVEDVAAAGEDAPVITEVIRGLKISEAITEYVADNDIDLVVMGTRGRHGVDRLLGSTTERVLASVSVPTLVVGDSGD